MGIYRGPGGSGDATNDASSEITLAVLARDAAQAAQAAAEAAQAAAETAETNAETAETNAETAETNAETAATNAASSASSASTSATNAASSASSASTSATNAASSASSASTSATNAASSASSASSSASSASTSATNAANSATAAQAAQAAAEAAFDAFDDIYLGAKSSNPTVDNDGNALTTGDQYFNTVSNELRVWNGSSWQAASTVGGTVSSLTVTGATALNGGATLGDASGDALTINSSAVSIPNGLNFDSNTLVIDATNNRVGIGTASPAQALDVNISQNAVTRVQIKNTNTGTSAQAGLYVANSDTANYYFSAGLLGTAFTSSGLFIQNSGQVFTGSQVDGLYIHTQKVGSPLVFGTEATEKMRITSAGNVGIGTSSPGVKLDVSGAVRSFVSGGTPIVYLGNGTTQHSIQNTSGAFTFFNDGTERMRIDSGGNLLVGSSSSVDSSFRLQVTGAGGTISASTGANANSLRFDNTNTTSEWSFGTNSPGVGNAGDYFAWSRLPSGGSWSEFMRITNTGNLLVGRSSSSGATYSAEFSNSAADNRLGLWSSGTLLGAIQVNTNEFRVTALGASTNLTFQTNSNIRATIDTSGNLGLGVTPSAWSSGDKVIDIGTGVSYRGSGTNPSVIGNAYYNGTNWIYKTTATATYYDTNNTGAFRWLQAASGTAGNTITFTQAMTLDASGQLLVGKTSQSIATTGCEVLPSGAIIATRSGDVSAIFNRTTSDGKSIELRRDNTAVGVIGSASGGIYFGSGSSGTERMRIDSSGNVGIGTTAPDAKLEVNIAATADTRSVIFNRGISDGSFQINNWSGAAGGTDALIGKFGMSYGTTKNTYINFYRGGSGTGGYMAFTTNNDTERMRIDSSGNVGIGTSSPDSKLRVDVNGGGLVSKFVSNTGSTYITVGAASTYQTQFGYNISSEYGFIQPIAAAGVYDDLVINPSGGNLGLGVTPSAWGSGWKALQVNTGPAIWSDGTRGFYSSNLYYNGTNRIYQTTGVALEYSQGAGGHVWSTATSGTAGATVSLTQAMTLNPSGNLLVGTTSTPSSSQVRLALVTSQSSYLQIGTTATNAGGVIGIDGTSSAMQFFTYTGAVGSETYTERMRIDSSGNLLVGRTSTFTDAKFIAEGSSTSFISRFRNTSATTPSGLFVLYTAASPNDTGNLFFRADDSTATRVEVRSNGGIANYSANNVNLSDVRTKTDIELAGSYLDKVCAIPVKTFKYKDQTDDLLNLGVIAQDVEAVAPELVDVSGFGETPEDGVPLKAIYQTDLVYALMKSIQELKAEVDSLKAQLNK